VKEVSHTVVSNGGIVRSVQNHGIRQLPHRFKAKYADREGNRYYERGRFLSIFYDSNPSVMRQVETVIGMNEEVLRNTHLKPRNNFMFVNNQEENKNPYVQKVVNDDRKDEEERAM